MNSSILDKATGEILENTAEFSEVGKPVFSESVLNIIPALCTTRLQMAKVGMNGHNKEFNYKYRKADDIYAAAGQALAQNGIMIIPSVVSHDAERIVTSKEKSATLTSVRMAIMMVHKSGEHITQFYTGAAIDLGDKGTYKAYTGCLKYHLMMTFLIGGDDAEDDSQNKNGNFAGDTTRNKTPIQSPRNNNAASSGSVKSPLTSNSNPPVITLAQVQELEKLIKDSNADEVKFLKCLQVDTLAQLPAERFEWAVKSLEAKKKQKENKDSSEVADTNMLIATLSARNIPYQLDEQNNEIHATPSFTDSGAKEFLKKQGFKWNSSGRAWIKKAA